MESEASIEALEHSREICIAPHGKEKEMELGNKQILFNTAPAERPRNQTNPFIVAKVELAKIASF